MVAAALLGGVLATAPQAQAANLTWNQTGAGPYSWTDSANWGGTGFPNAIGDVANLSGALAGAQTVNLNAIITIGELNFGATLPSSAAGYTLAAGTNGLLVLDDTDGTVSINKLNGSPSLDTISADIQFNDALTLSNNAGGGTLTFTGTIRSVASDVTLNGASIAGGAAILTGAIATAGGLIKDGGGIAQMNTNTTYAGTTWVKAGRLIANTAASIPVRSAITIDAGAVLETKAAAMTWGSIAGAGNVTNTGSARTVTIGRDDTSTSFSGTITADTPANIAITKIGAGTLTLSPSLASTYTGNTIINGGTVSLSFVNTALTSLLAATPLQITGGNFTMTGKAGLGANQLMGALTVGSTGGTITLVA
jgi:autotransporter-associated beta strand protein